MSQPITVYTARNIITMNPSQPWATAVAVRDGKVLSVGSLDQLRPWLDRYPHQLDHRFQDKVLMPGFIDPHLHPFLVATTLYAELITGTEWRLPWGTFPAIQGREAFLARLGAILASQSESDPLLVWGYHASFHGPLHRRDLDAASPDRPVLVWHRSAHDMWFNTAALEHFGLEEGAFQGVPQTNYEEGHFWEAGFLGIAPRLAPFLFRPDRYLEGTRRTARAIHHGGTTTVVEFSFGIADPELEWSGPAQVMDNEDTPFRVFFLPDLGSVSTRLGEEATFEWVRGLPAKNTRRLKFLNSVKLFADGAFFSQAMRLGAGFLDGHLGEWMTPPETLERLARQYWHAGYRIHVHCNGDLAVGLALDLLQKLLEERPRTDHRFTIEHCAYCNPDQVRRAARLGALISVNPFFLHEMGDIYAREAMGYDRASQMARVGTMAREGVPFALHSDCPMAPAQPLLLAWTAVNRLSAEGRVLAPEERLTVHQALRAITIDAAFMLGLEDDLGSVVAGKSADFTVLAEDPYRLTPGELKDIPVWGTLFEGRVFPCEGRS